MSRTLEQPGELRMESTWGVVRVEVRRGRICACVLPALRAEPGQPFRWKTAQVHAATADDRAALAKARRFILSVFRGQPGKPPALEWPETAPFTLRVWRALLTLAPGTVVGYGELARKVGRAGSARAVGRACGANPLPLFIPCHRVRAGDGSLGGFSGGLPWKRLLLDREARAARRSAPRARHP
ncbi:MAG TPA: methylated-DNA--[protein]-cysteine S-methyltransferase [Kiritimatiellia bacterium]|nr:methylated-DNA--[protein]-cysteine S-methyltransferase [Kiritimatiellia bacterium]HRZ11909.1 methylated-DNA--[protein]-cysteine S-methyltransferase [Kiritimatiellia bacterium]HSA17285.1 methylated-DNA--[protein]-cysteine S-methyltransferase [Kiritimatiellia bacterium]